MSPIICISSDLTNITLEIRGSYWLDKSVIFLSKPIKRLLLKPFGNSLLTSTSDGKEFAGHKEIAQAVNVDFYCAHPYSS